MNNNNIYYIQKTTDSLESYLKELPMNSNLPFSKKNGMLNTSYEIQKMVNNYLVYSFVDNTRTKQMDLKELLNYLKEIIEHTTLIFEK
jgi:cell fate (sporulation/competence/biofilm development) regulator YmcA (YheA/YmcA/DUF963 family)